MESVSVFPAIFEFKFGEGEETSHGMVLINSVEEKFVVQQTRYFNNTKPTQFHHYELDLQKNIGSNIVTKDTRYWSYPTGSTVNSGDLTMINGTDDFHGMIAYNYSGIIRFELFRGEWNSGALSLKRAYAIEGFEPSKIISISTGFLLVGTKTTNGDKNVCVMKYSFTSDMIWEKEFGGAGEDVGIDAVQLCDGSYGVLAHTYSKGSGDRDIWYLNVSGSGFLISDKTFGGSGYDEPQAILRNGYCELYIAGNTTRFGAPEHDGYVLKIHSNGNLLWEKTFGTQYHDGFDAITQIANTETFLVAGRSMQGVGQPEDLFIVCFDENGNELWRKKYGDPNLTELPHTIIATNEYYYVSCNRLSIDNKYSSVFIKDKFGN